MCKNCKTLPRNLVLRTPQELNSMLCMVCQGVTEDKLVVVSETYPLELLIQGRIKNPYQTGMQLRIQCKECGEYFVCAYEPLKGAGFWNRMVSPY